MKARVRTAALAGIALAGGTATAAEPVVERGASAVVLVSGADDREVLTGRASGWARGGFLFDNQWEFGAGLAAAAERDDPNRDPRGGRFGDCPPASAVCPSVGGRPLRGFVSGFTAAGPEADRGGRLSLEQAYLYGRGGWGEISVGRDAGVGERFSLLPPTVLAASGAIDPSIDGTGLGDIALRNDVAGRSAKIVVVTTRILGLQAGAAWTPRAEHEGLDQGYRRRDGDPLTFEPEEIAEAAVSFAHTFAGGWETAAAVTATRAETANGEPAFAGMTSWSAGITVARGPWRVGAAYLENDNGWRGGGRDYRAWGASGVYTAGDWSFMLEAAAASDDLVFTDARAVTLAARRSLSGRVAVAGGAGWREVSSPQTDVSSRMERNDRGIRAFLEISFGL